MSQFAADEALLDGGNYVESRLLWRPRHCTVHAQLQSVRVASDVEYQAPRNVQVLDRVS